MNAQARPESTALATVTDQPAYLPEAATSTTSMVLDRASMESMMAFANMMANGTVTIPKHLQKHPADCLAVITQAMQWGMNPFAVAQKTHMTQGGALGYDGQLINAVVTSRAPVKDRFHYKFLGDWAKILGKVEERKSDNGGKYYVSAWPKSAEDGLGVIVGCTLKGESTPREVTVMMTQAYPRFSTQWATDPQQQICYLAVRKWARRYTPDVILGVQAADDPDEAPPREMGPAEEIKPTIPPDLLKAANEAAAKGVVAYQVFWEKTGKDNRNTLAAHHVSMKQTAIDADRARTVDTATQAQAPAAAQPTAAAAPAGKPDMTTKDGVLAAMEAAPNQDALDIAADWGKELPPEDHAAIGEAYTRLATKFRE